ncbi:hypothetical protein SK128_014663, partial [Halocaridina rubra]
DVHIVVRKKGSFSKQHKSRRAKIKSISITCADNINIATEGNKTRCISSVKGEPKPQDKNHEATQQQTTNWIHLLAPPREMVSPSYAKTSFRPP